MSKYIWTPPTKKEKAKAKERPEPSDEIIEAAETLAYNHGEMDPLNDIDVRPVYIELVKVRTGSIGVKLDWMITIKRNKYAEQYQVSTEFDTIVELEQWT